MKLTKVIIWATIVMEKLNQPFKLMLLNSLVEMHMIALKPTNESKKNVKTAFHEAILYFGEVNASQILTVVSESLCKLLYMVMYTLQQYASLSISYTYSLLGRAQIFFIWTMANSCWLFLISKFNEGCLKYVKVKITPKSCGTSLKP